MTLLDPAPEELKWQAYLTADWELRFARGTRVLDIGCGPGIQMETLVSAGCEVRGVEPVPEMVEYCRNRGLHVVAGVAEALPEADASYDGVVCKGVLPFTREDQALAEIARVLKPAGICYLLGLGSGYYLRLLLQSPSWKLRFYASRSLANSWIRSLTGRRLPGFMGDTIYQTNRRLRRFYRRVGLELVREVPSPRFLGFPVFLHHELRRR